MTPPQINALIAEWANEWESATIIFFLPDGTFAAGGAFFKGWETIDGISKWLREKREKIGQIGSIGITRIPYDYTTNDEAVRRALGRLTLEQCEVLCGILEERWTWDSYTLKAIALSPLQKATALARMIEEEKGRE